MTDLELLAAFGAATVRVATPLAYAAVGEVIAERSGVLNLGIEGAMLAGALGAAIGATLGGPLVGVACGLGAGIAVALVVALVAVWGRADQIITGTAVTLGSIGLTGLIAQRTFGNAGAGLQIATLDPVAIPGLAAIPVLGEAFFRQSLLTYALYAVVPLVGWWLFGTASGRRLRATGLSLEAARAAGVRTRAVQTAALAFGGAMAGIGGASLVLAQVGTFTEKMTAGRGFIAIAIVVLGRAHPVGAAIAALLFGAATALQYLFQASGTAVPYQLFIALPYVLALGVIAASRRRSEIGDR
jgi:general nucleoside transport system permease protein